jgi:hypothetical protein
MSTQEQVIEKFLADIDPIETARLAAMMAPPQKTFSAIALAEAALEIQDAVAEAIRKRREKLIESINTRNLYIILNGGSNFSDTQKEIIYDYHKAISNRLELLDADGIEAQQMQIDRDREALEKELGPFPSSPCNLEAALRYGTGENQLEWSVIESAFIDLLRISEATNELHGEYERDSKQLDFQIKHRQAILAQPDLDPLIRASDQQVLANFESDLKNLNATEGYIRNFSPGNQGPQYINSRAAETFRKHWEGSTNIKQRSIIWIARDFRAHWKNYKDDYLKIHDDKKKAADAKAKQSAKGAATREHNKWVKLTTDFNSYHNQDKKKNVDLKTLLDEFIKKQTELKDPKAISNAKEFLGTIFNHNAHKGSVDTVMAILKKRPLGAPNKDTVSCCLALVSPPKKSAAKKN